MSVIYLKLNFNISPITPWRNVLIAKLGEIGFESFEDTDLGFHSYIQKSVFDLGLLNQLSLFKNKDIQVSWVVSEIQPQNWNETWEKDFKPMRIGSDCIIRAHFHEKVEAKYDLIITPKMSFGTGHHETTRMIMSFLLETDCTEKTVLDMGTGTGVLAILADKKGAKSVLAVDFDQWCVENTNENLKLNKSRNIEVLKGSWVPKVASYDLILANINRNVLLVQISDYAAQLNAGGHLIMSGFYNKDLKSIQECCASVHLKFIRNLEENNWVAASFSKQ
jgi:ribosomal protein L11 methyltransferase